MLFLIQFGPSPDQNFLSDLFTGLAFPLHYILCLQLSQDSAVIWSSDLYHMLELELYNFTQNKCYCSFCIRTTLHIKAIYTTKINKSKTN